MESRIYPKQKQSGFPQQGSRAQLWVGSFPGIPFFFCLISIFFTTIPAFAQDTTLYTLPGSVDIVDSLRLRFQNSANYTRFEPDSFGQFGVTGITADAVLGQAAGLYVRNYGGHGGVRTISVRGFSTQQTTVSINEVPYSSAQTGTVNFADFFPEGYQALSLSRSATSPAYNPLGGNVDFSIRPKKTAAQLQAGVGSFGEQIARLSTDYLKGRTALRIGYHALRADDDYPFSLNGESGIRNHAGFLTRRYQLFMSYQASPQTELSYLATGFFNEQEVPGPVVKGSPVQPDGNLMQEDHFFYLRMKHHARRIRALLPARSTTTVRYHFDKLDYLVSGQSQRYLNRDLFAAADFVHVFRQQTLESSFQYDYSQLEGNNLAIDFQPVEAVNRHQVNAGLSHKFYLGGTDSAAHRLITESVFRVNYLDAYGLLPNAGLNLNWQPGGQMEVFSHLHYGHRVPAFNELYYFGYGNAGLEPEKVRSADVGVMIRREVGLPVSLKLSAFANQTRDKIISVPINPARWSTYSIGKTQSLGGEVSLEVRADDHNYAYLTYTLQKAQDLTRPGEPLLPYTPQELASYGFQLATERMELGANGQFSGWRYSLLQNGAGSFLPAYHVLNVQAGYLFPTRWFSYKIMLQVENVLNARYEVIKSYPMPPGSYRIIALLRF